MKQMKPKDLDERLEKLNGWKLIGNAIEKNYKFRDFKNAVGFINKVAEVAETANHHPDILLWNWNNVRLTLTTHTASGLTEKDFELASKIDQIKL